MLNEIKEIFKGLQYSKQGTRVVINFIIYLLVTGSMLININTDFFYILMRNTIWLSIFTLMIPFSIILVITQICFIKLYLQEYFSTNQNSIIYKLYTYLNTNKYGKRLINCFTIIFIVSLIVILQSDTIRNLLNKNLYFYVMFSIIILIILTLVILIYSALKLLKEVKDVSYLSKVDK